MGHRTDTELHRANERFFELLAHMARHDASPCYELVRHIYRPLNLLDTAALKRAAQRPYALFDCHFQDEPKWLGMKTVSPKGRPDAWASSFPRRSAVELTRRVLTLAWHSAAELQASRCARLGLSPTVASVLLTFSLDELDWIADRHVGILRPRWEGRTGMWRRVLDAAGDDEDGKEFDGVDLQAAQWLASDLMAGMVR
jgi:hypothetical protein